MDDSKKRGRGRPKAKAPRTSHGVSMTEDEWLRLGIEATRLDLSISEYVRIMCIPPAPTPDS